MRLRLFLYEGKSLRVDEEHAEIECIFDLLLHEFEGHEHWMLEFIFLSQIHPEIPLFRDHTSKCCLNDRGDAHTRFESIDGSPETRSFGSSAIKY